MLFRSGERLVGAAVESTGDVDRIPGAGLLPVETRFSTDKTVAAVERDLRGCGPLAGAEGPVTGYEIHMGDSRLLDDADRPFDGEGAARGDVLGTYLHGLFENANVRDAFVDGVYRHAGKRRPRPGDEEGSPYAKAAALVDGLALDLG